MPTLHTIKPNDRNMETDGSQWSAEKKNEYTEVRPLHGHVKLISESRRQKKTDIGGGSQEGLNEKNKFLSLDLNIAWANFT